MSTGLTLYGGGPSRWIRVYWMVNDLDLKLTPRNPFKDPEARAELAALNPRGNVGRRL